MNPDASLPRLRVLVALVVLVCASHGSGCAAGSSSGTSANPGPGTGAGGSSSSGTGTTGGSAGSSGAAGASGGFAGEAGVGTGAGGSTTMVPSTGAAGSSAGAAGEAGGSQDAGTSDGAGLDGAPACNVALTPLMPGSFVGLEAGPLSSLRVQATVSGYSGVPTPAPMPTWVWSVRLAGGQSLADINFTPVGTAGDTIDIKLAEPGRYEIQARIEGAPQCDRSPVIVTVDPPGTPSFLVRVTPPSSSRLPTRETTLAASDVATASHTVDLADSSASVVSLLPTDARGFPLTSYVVVTSASTALDLQAYTATGPLIASLVPAQTYNVLVVPDGGWAPLLVTGMPGTLAQNLEITSGVSVTGTARDGGGHPVKNARVILRAGLLPSTVGVSDGTGAFGVSARAGVFAAVISPPAGSGLAEAHVASTPGINVGGGAGAASLTLDMAWTAQPAASLTLTVRGADGTAVAGAQVRAESSAEVSGVGTLSVRAGAGAAVVLPATGTARADAVTDGNGVAALGLLPAGPYHVTVAPAASTQAAMGELDVALPAAGLAQDVTLAPLVTQAGTLTPAAKAAGAKITALDEGELPPATLATAIADASGAYTLALSPGRTYELLVQPATAGGYAASVLATFSPGAAPVARVDALPTGLTWKGAVVAGARPVAGAVVQMFCVGPSAACLDPTIAVAQGATAADGTLSLVVPSPN